MSYLSESSRIIQIKIAGLKVTRCCTLPVIGREMNLRLILRERGGALSQIGVEEFPKTVHEACTMNSNFGNSNISSLITSKVNP